MFISEAKRCVHDALCVIRNLISDPRVVAGGGAVETACSLAVLQGSKAVRTVEQHAVEAFAEALMSVPSALAANSGLDSIETLGTLKAKQLKEKCPNIGVNCLDGKTGNMMELQVYESLNSKKHQLALATQVRMQHDTRSIFAWSHFILSCVSVSAARMPEVMCGRLSRW